MRASSAGLFIFYGVTRRNRRGTAPVLYRCLYMLFIGHIRRSLERVAEHTGPQQGAVDVRFTLSFPASDGTYEKRVSVGMAQIVPRICCGAQKKEKRS
eukprot:1225818-Pyramimonas_sp.AAC.1